VFLSFLEAISLVWKSNAKANDMFSYYCGEDVF